MKKGYGLDVRKCTILFCILTEKRTFVPVMNQKVWNKDFTLLASSNFLMCCAYYSLVSTLPVYISQNLHTPDSIVGITMAAYTIAAVLIRPFTGFGLDRLGRKTIFLTALLLYGSIFAGYLFAFTILFILVVRFLHGFTWGVTTTANSTIAVDIIPRHKRGEGIGYFGISTTLGMALGPVVGSFIYQHLGYSGMFLAGLSISMVSFGLASMIHYPRYHSSSQHIAFRWDNLFEMKVILPAINLLIIMMTYGGLVSFIALYGHEIGIVKASGFFLVYAAGIILSRFTSGKVMDRQGPRKIIIFCLSLLIIGFPLLAMVKTDAGYFGSAIILGFGNGVIWPTFQTMANNIVPPGRRGAANSTLFTLLDLGMGLGMILTGFISQVSSIGAAFLVCSGIATVGLLFFLRFTLKCYLILAAK
ncbi:MAG: MFS transporter [Bacteroidetes bacterium]|nr:MFS transporter [Bacteroidota bacterium]